MSADTANVDDKNFCRAVMSGHHVGPILSPKIGRCEQALVKLANLSATNLTYKSAENVGRQKLLVRSYHLAFRHRTS